MATPDGGQGTPLVGAPVGMTPLPRTVRTPFGTAHQLQHLHYAGVQCYHVADPSFQNTVPRPALTTLINNTTLSYLQAQPFGEEKEPNLKKPRMLEYR